MFHAGVHSAILLPKKHPALSVAILIILVLTLGASTVRADTMSTPNSTSASATSVVNQVRDFYAEGSSGDYHVKISSQGGYLTNGVGLKMFLLPWGYITAQWAVGTIHIVFLVNVTATDFHVAFLYFTNSSSSFILRLFRYQGGVDNTITFDGSSHVYNRTVITSSVLMPRIMIQPRPQTQNSLSVFGPELHVHSNTGQMINGSTILNIYPLHVQVFRGIDEYNELWSLLSDGSGNYYFAILYMRNSDSDHVIVEHQIRLNDYQAVGGRTFDAKWKAGRFPGYLTVRLPSANATVKINGFPFRSDGQGRVSMDVPTGPLTVEVPDEVSLSANAKMCFDSWPGHGTANPLIVDLISTLDLKPIYVNEYLLVIETEYGDVEGSGWYREGENATFAVPAAVTLNNGTQRVFVRWSGDYNSTVSRGWIVVNSPKHLIATWKTKFEMKLQLAGVPGNASASVTVNGQSLLVNGSVATPFWVNEKTELSIIVESTQIQGTASNYNFKEMRVDGQAVNSSIAAVKPLTIEIIYSESSKLPSSVSLTVTPATTIEGYPLTISGSITGPAEPSSIMLLYSVDSATWNTLGQAEVGSDGRFAYAWKSTDPGTYFIKAYWPGNTQYLASSQVVSASVIKTGLPSLDRLGLSQLELSVPLLSTLLKVIGSLMLLGVLVGNAIAPGALILGYFVGSLLVGFVLIFPVSTLVLSVSAARRHRAPGLVWLTPLITIWIIALGLIMTNGLLSFAQPLVQASEMLLIFSNTLLGPLTLSVLVSRSVAS